MTDDGGGDAKVIAVPVEKVLPMYKKIQSLDDLEELRVKQIQHFFEHYKDLEPGKWVKIEGWAGIDEAKAELVAGVEAFKKQAKA